RYPTGCIHPISAPIAGQPSPHTPFASRRRVGELNLSVTRGSGKTFNSGAHETVIFDPTALGLHPVVENGTPKPLSITPLEGTFELSHGAGSVTFPTGSSRCHVKATWKQPGRSE